MVLWLIYIGYLMLRHYVEDAERRATFSAVFGIVAFVNVPLSYFSIRWWRTQHPQPVLAGGENSGLAPPMYQTLLVCLVAFTLLFLYLVKKRIELQHLREELDERHRRTEHGD
jgi:heme exporter protein C